MTHRVNPDTEALLRDVTERVQQAISARDCPAIVALHGYRDLILSDYDYLRDEATALDFERRVADQARRIRAARWVFAVPEVLQTAADGSIAARPASNLPLREGEQEAIVWTSFDADDGADYGVVPYTRRPNGEPVFGEPAVFTIPLQPAEHTPGWALLRRLMDGGSEPIGS